MRSPWRCAGQTNTCYRKKGFSDIVYVSYNGAALKVSELRLEIKYFKVAPLFSRRAWSARTRSLWRCAAASAGRLTSARWSGASRVRGSSALTVGPAPRALATLAKGHRHPHGRTARLSSVSPGASKTVASGRLTDGLACLRV